MKQTDPIEFSGQPDCSTILTLRGPCNPKHPITVLLGGSPRSGTSPAAALIDGMGIAMDDSYDGHFERVYFKNNCKDQHLGQVDSHIERLNAHYGNRSWGTQLWINPLHFGYMMARVRNPVVIITARDYVGIATRWASVKFGGETLNDRVQRILFETQQTMSIFLTSPCPSVAISFDRMKQAPGKLHDDLAAFLGRSADKKNAVARIAPNSGYLLQAPPKSYSQEKQMLPT